jgi:hypothetical protein
MGKQVTDGEHSMLMTIYFAICHFSCPDIVFRELPQMPPKGVITHALLSILITWIFGVFTLRAIFSLTKQKLVAEICAIRWTGRLIQSDDSHLPTNDVPPFPNPYGMMECAIISIRWLLFFDGRHFGYWIL